MNYRQLCEQVDDSFHKLITEIIVREQPDSRAFGAYVEKMVKDRWIELCKTWGKAPNPHPGRRTIYDVSFTDKGHLVGIDIKSKDLDETRYSNGGICAVSNLLRFIVKEEGLLILSEFGYTISGAKVNFDYVASIPFHCLPEKIYRIENLGTGQLRLNYTLKEALPDVNWSRSRIEFCELFAKLCIGHYDKVSKVTRERRKAIEEFVESGYKKIKL